MYLFKPKDVDILIILAIALYTSFRNNEIYN